MTAKILLAFKQALVREGIASLLMTTADFIPIAEAADGCEALRLAVDTHPDVALIEARLPCLNGSNLTQELLLLDPAPKVVVVALQGDDELLVDALKSGASAYLGKSCSFGELRRAIGETLKGRIYLGALETTALVEGYLRQPERLAQDWVLSELSPRERQVLQMLAEGKSSAMIASHLGLSRKTVDTHRQNLKRKLGVASIAELTKFAIRGGLTSLDL